MHFGKKTSQAFTMTEVTAVLAVVAALIGWMILAMNKQKDHSLSLACQNNLKKLQSALQLYVNDNEGLLPHTIEARPYGYWQSTKGSWVLGNAKMDVGEHWITNGVLWPFVNEFTPYKCPADDSYYDKKPTLPRLRSFGMSQFFNQSTTPGSGTQVGPGKISRIDEAKADQVYSFMGVDQNTIDSGVFAITYNLWEKNIRLASWLNFPSERHSKGANLIFLDGHVEHHVWEYTPKTKPPTVSRFHAINVRDQNDMMWIFSKTPWMDWIPPKKPD